MVAKGRPSDTAEVSVFGRRRSFATLAAFGLLIGGVVLAAPAGAAVPPTPASVSIDAVGNATVDVSWSPVADTGVAYQIWTKIGDGAEVAYAGYYTTSSAHISVRNEYVYQVGVRAVEWDNGTV